MANKLAIVALAAAAVAAAPALAQEAPSPSPGSQQALRVCDDAAGPFWTVFVPFLEGKVKKARFWVGLAGLAKKSL